MQFPSLLGRTAVRRTERAEMRMPAAAVIGAGLGHRHERVWRRRTASGGPQERYTSSRTRTARQASWILKSTVDDIICAAATKAEARREAC